MQQEKKNDKTNTFEKKCPYERENMNFILFFFAINYLIFISQANNVNQVNSKRINKMQLKFIVSREVKNKIKKIIIAN